MNISQINMFFIHSSQFLISFIEVSDKVVPFMTQRKVKMSEFSNVETAKKFFSVLKFTGFVVSSFDGKRIYVKPSTIVIFISIISCLTASLFYSWLSFDMSQSSIINVGNQLTANNVILIAIFTMIFNCVYHVEIF